MCGRVFVWHKKVNYACGMGEDQYQFQSSGGVKTAREVISENSKLFRTLKKHEIVLKLALTSPLPTLQHGRQKSFSKAVWCIKTS